MKKIVCLILLLYISFGCSKSEEDELTIISSCFLVKDSATELPVQGATIRITGYTGDCSFFGDCEFRSWNGHTNPGGEVCINYDSDYKISSIVVTHPQYESRSIETFGLSDPVTEIYLIAIP